MTFDSTIYCGECAECRAGHINLCSPGASSGLRRLNINRTAPSLNFLPYPNGFFTAFPTACLSSMLPMVEPVSIALHAVGRVKLAAESVAVVIGSGMIGLLVIQSLRHAGAKQIVAVDLESSRLDLALTLGATHAIRADDPTLAAQITKITPRGGADAAFEVVGIGPTVALAIQVVRRGGDVVLVGNLAQKTEFPLQSVVTRELTLHGSCGSAGEYPLAIDLISRGIINVAPLISAVAPLADGAAWFSRLTSPEGRNQLKVILEPGGEM